MPFDPTLNERLRGLAIRKTPTDEGYAASYPLFLDFFRRRVAINNPNANDVKAAVYLVYEWMRPSRLRSAHLDTFADAAAAIAAALTKNLRADDLETIKTFVSGSVVATSKFLHFLAPRRYAIWDSNVARAAYGFADRKQYDSVTAYLIYLEDVRAWSLPAATDRIVTAHLGSDATELRRKEFALFHLGIAERE